MNWESNEWSGSYTGGNSWTSQIVGVWEDYSETQMCDKQL